MSLFMIPFLGALILACLVDERWEKAFSNKGLMVMGMISYRMYLYNKLPVFAVTSVWSHEGKYPASLMVAAFVGLVVIAIISFKILEASFLALMSNYRRKEKATS